MMILYGDGEASGRGIGVGDCWGKGLALDADVLLRTGFGGGYGEGKGYGNGELFGSGSAQGEGWGDGEGHSKYEFAHEKRKMAF